MSTSTISLLTSVLQPLLPLSLFFLSGIATTLSLWIVPLLLLSTTTSRTLIHQFAETIRRGYTFLQPSSRILAFLLLLTTVLTYQLSDPVWRWYAAAGFILLQTAWWEVVFIFPINDEVALMEGKLGDGEVWLNEKEQKRLEEMIERWRAWHLGRIVMPFVAGVLTLVALL